jgi:hypothetical protein
MHFGRGWRGGNVGKVKLCAGLTIVADSHSSHHKAMLTIVSVFFVEAAA